MPLALTDAGPSLEFQQLTQRLFGSALKALGIPCSLCAASDIDYSGARQAALQYELLVKPKYQDLPE